jgi:heat shock protein beta
MQKGGDLNLIGQFGVGFYSVYLVADYVEVVSKHNDEAAQYIWESKADGAFVISEDTEGEPLGRGTMIRIHLKEDALEYAEQSKLRELVQKYSEFMNFPIYLQTEKEVDVPVEADTDADAAEDDVADVDADADANDSPASPKTVKQVVRDWELLNDNKAIWLRPAAEVTEEEYEKFYKALSKDYQAPASYSHFRAEGDVEFKAILFVPAKSEPNMFENYHAKASGLKLYVRRVFISDEFNELLPKYLSFMKGIVDSDTLPLNVARESLQQHSSLKTIKKKLVRKALDMLRKLADDSAPKEPEEGEDAPEEKPAGENKYETVWKNFGKAIKLGVIDDSSNRNRLAKLLRFVSSKSDSKLTSLEEYVAGMKPWQKQIFYLAGDSIETLQKSPFLEKLLDKDVEVIYFTEPIDEYLMQSLTEFEDFKFQNVQKDDLKLGDEDEDEKKSTKALKTKFKPLTSWWKALLPAADIESVKLSNRLATTPCIVVSSKYGWSANMERIMKAQAMGDDSRSSMMKGKKVLEINPSHPIVRELRAAVSLDPEDASAKAVALVLWEAALLESGYSLDDPKGFSGRVLSLAQSTLKVDVEAVEAAEAKAEAEEAKEKAAKAAAEAEAAAAAEAAEEAEEATTTGADTHDEL